MSRQAESIQADVAIVGSGVAGALIGSRLAAAGVRVVILEAGPKVERQDAVNAYRAAPMKTPESPYPNTPYAPHPDVLNLDGYLVQQGPETFKSTYLRQVGGTTWHWLGTAVRLVPDDFRLKSAHGVGVDWPIAYDELEPWYLAAERELGVAGDDAADVRSPRSAPYPLPPIPPTYGDRALADALAPYGLAVVPTPAARNSQEYQGRPQCCGNATCIPCCPIQAKYDATVHVKLAEEVRAQILADHVAHRVTVDAGGRATGVDFLRPDRSEGRVEAKVVVLAAAAVETAKLLLLSRTDAMPEGLANRSGQVGRNLADHPALVSLALAPTPVYPYRSPLATSGIEQLRDGPERSTRSAFRIEIGNDGWSWPGLDPVGVAGKLIGDGLRGADLFKAVGERTSRQLRLASLTEQLPDPENRVQLHPTETDALGLPRPLITYRIDQYTRGGIEAARAIHTQVFDAIGATDRWEMDSIQGAGHLMGTYRMGSDPATSVADREGRCHDHANLFLAGAGLFPTTGTANPTLTIAALALLTADAIGRDLGAPVATPAAVATP